MYRGRLQYRSEADGKNALRFGVADGEVELRKVAIYLDFAVLANLAFPALRIAAECMAVVK